MPMRGEAYEKSCVPRDQPLGEERVSASRFLPAYRNRLPGPERFVCRHTHLMGVESL